MSDGNTDSLLTDPGLLRRMAMASDSDAWSEFHERYHVFIRELATRNGLPEHDAKDLEQLVLLGLVEGIVGFKPRPRRGSFRRWLAQRVRWRITDFVRARRCDREDPLPDQDGDSERALPELIEEAVDLAEAMDRTERVALVRTALCSLSARMNPKNLQAFDLVVLQGNSPEQAARVLRMSRASVYLACHRVEKALKKRVAEMLAARAQS